ncbi:hypothetical protein CC77DRAFT_625627 [Alternaria alternata]|jgi:lipopolysaccharide-induced tumor necrosis factor-alpha factor|uniref:LITAF domain-containing protein n=3 Tax=Alternaria sect. Alternaria TaxID=2499237 RepID=A0A177DYE9_ALTAL|nr:hypothetical protein CC77DRAFT_625627 [Alternaria alternata]XP_051589259.1 uncharacterized protein J4E82_004778 [Alternaria postmessia]KAB2105710.1 hypothetical protein AG0111_0g6048 [Alternaria gaisen]RII06607.1 hypothetical protein CUC08_Gglean009833 [Alternaria sp. MG1]RYN38160.1 hypothetical protein AA0115_g136 [Alternaria tenuissima]KAH6859387.1 LITAF-like zinc ribbon domain-containing protein [Alternaria alternata]KAI5376556.1 hypothetical protein J4E82_004778 [Alternaria postmessia]
MEKQNVPMQQYPQSPDMTGQPPIYHQDPNAQHYQQQPAMYAQHPQGQPAGSPPPQHPQGAYIQPDHAGAQPGMPPQQQSGAVYQNATPIASLNRGPAPADCPACGQRAMTNVAFETGNTTHAWALGLCCLCCLGCIPYVMNSLKDVQHKCGRCGVLLATWHRSGTTEVHIHS